MRRFVKFCYNFGGITALACYITAAILLIVVDGLPGWSKIVGGLMLCGLVSWIVEDM